MAKKVDIPVSKYKCNASSVTINYTDAGKSASVSISKNETKELPNVPSVKSFVDRGYLTLVTDKKEDKKTTEKVVEENNTNNSNPK